MRFEKKYEPLASRSTYFWRILRHFLYGILIISFALGIGILGYHHFGEMEWIDAFHNAAMILSGMGQVTILTTPQAKLFAGFYALFSGLLFISVVGLIFAPVVHRFLHKFHLGLRSSKPG